MAKKKTGAPGADAQKEKTRQNGNLQQAFDAAAHVGMQAPMEPGTPEPDNADETLLMAMKAEPSGLRGPVGKEQVRQAEALLEKYKQGKEALSRRIVDNENWWKLHGCDGGGDSPDSAWLFNSIANKHADAMDNYPEPNVLPRARDDEQTAKTLSKILPVALEQGGYEQVYSDVWWYKLKQGTGVKGVFWDTGKNGIGDIDIRKVDVLNLFWEPGVTDIQKSPALFHVELVNNDTIRERWPFAGALSGPCIDTARYVYDDAVDVSEKSAVVDWYYKKNGALHFCKFVNGTVLYASENDPAYAQRGYYDHGKYPFVFDTLFPVEGSPCGFGYIDVMKGCQQAINELDRSIVRNAKACSRARYFVRDDGGVNEKEFMDLDSDLIHTSGSLGEDALRQLEYAPLSGIYVQILNNKIEELKETSGNRDFSQGSTTSGVTAASAIAALQEAGSKLSRDMLKSGYRAFKEECYLCIELMRQFYDEPRCFRITGDAGRFDYAVFSNANIAGQDMGEEFGVTLGERLPIFDVTVIPAKKSAFSRLSQNELAKEFYGLGFFNPQLADQSLACLDMMDFDGKEKVMERVQANGTLYQQLVMMRQQMAKLAAIVDAQNGTTILQGIAQDDRTAQGDAPAQDGKNVTTDGMGRSMAGDDLATQARRRALEGATPK